MAKASSSLPPMPMPMKGDMGDNMTPPGPMVPASKKGTPKMVKHKKAKKKKKC